MRIFHSLKVPKNVNGGPLGFFNIHPVAKYQTNRRGPIEDIKKFRKKVTQSRKRSGKVS